MKKSQKHNGALELSMKLSDSFSIVVKKSIVAKIEQRFRLGTRGDFL
jgi:hypothetical protein